LRKLGPEVRILSGGPTNNKKGKMRKKLKRKWEIGTGILTLVLIMAFSIMVMLANRGYAMDEVERNPGNDKCNSTVESTTWIQKEWNEIVEYQKKGWAEGKEQLALNKQQLVNLPNTVVSESKDLFSNIGTALNKVLGN
jgi:hypothetical protein